MMTSNIFKDILVESIYLKYQGVIKTSHKIKDGHLISSTLELFVFSLLHLLLSVKVASPKLMETIIKILTILRNNSKNYKEKLMAMFNKFKA